MFFWIKHESLWFFVILVLTKLQDWLGVYKMKFSCIHWRVSRPYLMKADYFFSVIILNNHWKLTIISSWFSSVGMRWTLLLEDPTYQINHNSQYWLEGYLRSIVYVLNLLFIEIEVKFCLSTQHLHSISFVQSLDLFLKKI